MSKRDFYFLIIGAAIGTIFALLLYFAASGADFGFVFLPFVVDRGVTIIDAPWTPIPTPRDTPTTAPTQCPTDPDTGECYPTPPPIVICFPEPPCPPTQTPTATVQP